MEWNTYQNNVFSWSLKKGEGNGFVDSVAGSGKTAVLEETVRRFSWNTSVLAAAFNTDIRDVLKTRFEKKMNVKVSTFNGMGWGNLLRLFPSATLNNDKVDICFQGTDPQKNKFGWLVRKLIDLLRYYLEFSPSQETIERLMGYYGLEVGEIYFDYFLQLH